MKQALDLRPEMLDGSFRAKSKEVAWATDAGRDKTDTEERQITRRFPEADTRNPPPYKDHILYQPARPNQEKKSLPIVAAGIRSNGIPIKIFVGYGLCAE